MIAQNKTKKLSIKKVLAFLTAVCMTVALLFPLMSVKAFAAAPTSYTDITADTSASVSISTAGSSQYFRFVPTQSGTYTFYSEGSYDTYVHLLDASGTELLTNDDGGSGTNFSLYYECTANATYYVRARMLSSSTTGTFTLYVRTDSVAADPPSVNTANTTYSLFNSGKTTTSGSRYSSSSNYNESSFTNGGYDLYSSYSQSSIRSIRLGLSFTMEANATEVAQVTIYAYDVDEGQGERDCIRIVDETTGERTILTNTSGKDYLSGQDSTWSTTTFNIPANLLIKDHSYHFENEETVSGWVVYIRSVDMQVNGLDISDPGPSVAELDLDFSGSISSTGTVTTSLIATAVTEKTYELEYKATYLAEGDQKGGTTKTATIYTSSTTVDTTFSLESGASRGTYEITIYVRYNSQLVSTRTFTASYGYSAVSYNPNGGSQNIPTDITSYSDGDTVTVLFTYTPSKYGYVFLGWDTDRNATTPAYTANGNNTFVIGSTDVTLYAIWASASCSEHTAGEWIIDEAPTATQTGIRHKECTVCHEVIETEVMPVLAQLTIARVEVATGGTVRVTIDVQNNPGIIGAVLTLNYDSALTLVSAEAGGAWSVLSLTLPGEYTSGCNFVWDGVNTADYTNGTIITLTFEVPDTATAGTVYGISASYSSDNMINANLEHVDVAIVNGCIAVVEVIGDVNGDGVADAADVVILRRYLAGGYNVTINQEAADMNGDGQITVADVVLLRRQLVA